MSTATAAIRMAPLRMSCQKDSGGESLWFVERERQDNGLPAVTDPASGTAGHRCGPG
jgi:hypothetical protein